MLVQNIANLAACHANPIIEDPFKVRVTQSQNLFIELY